MNFSPVLSSLRDMLNGVIIRVRWWIKPPRRADALNTQDKVLLALKKTFIEHHVNLPIQKQRIIV